MSNKLFIKSFLLSLFLCCLPSFACAQGWSVPTDSAFGASTGHDLSLFYLSEIFGTVGNVLHSTNGQFVGKLFYHFNVAILAVAGLWLTYTVSTFAFKAAQEGSWMGQNRNAAVIMLRIALGIGLLIPSPATGYSIFQDVVANVVVYSVKLADAVWNTAVDYIVKDGGAMYYQPKKDPNNAPINEKNAQTLLDSFQKIETSESCMYIGTAVNRQAHGDSYITPYSVQDSGGKFKFPGGVDFSSNASNAMNNDACGSTQWLLLGGNGSKNTLRHQALMQVIDELQPVSKHLACLSLSPALRAYASECSTSNILTPKQVREESIHALMNALLDYSSLMLPIAGNQDNSGATPGGASAFRKIAEQDGWASAGTYFWKLINFQSKANQDHQLPVLLNYQSWSVKSAYVDDAAQTLDQFPQVSKTSLDQYKNYLSFSYGAAGGSVALQNDGSLENSAKHLSTLDKVASIGMLILVAGKLNSIKDVFKNIDPNPILWLHHLGMVCLALAGGLIAKIAWLVMGLGFADAICQATFNAATPTQLIFGWVKPIILGVVSALAMAGFFLGFYIPFYPTILYTCEVLGWIILVIESMVAAAIVLLGLTHPEGHDFLGKAEQALMLLLQVFVKPVAIVMGFLIAAILAVVSLQFVSHVYAGVVANIFHTGNASGLTRIINTATDNIIHEGSAHFLNVLIMPGLVLMFCIFVYIAATKSFSLIYVLSDNLLKWIGGPVTQSDSARLADQFKGNMAQGSKIADSLTSGEMEAYHGTGKIAGEVVKYGAEA